MPKYRITTRREVMAGTLIGSSATVDSLDEARSLAEDAILNSDDGTDATTDRAEARGLPETGGTIGPLPDGTVIEVRPA